MWARLLTSTAQEIRKSDISDHVKVLQLEGLLLFCELAHGIELSEDEAVQLDMSTRNLKLIVCDLKIQIYGGTASDARS